MSTRPENPFLVRDSIIIPTATKPKIDMNDKARGRVRATVLKSVQDRLLFYASAEGRKLPEKVTLVLGDFNVGDPMAYVLLQETGTVYEVELHNSGDPPDLLLEDERPLLARPFAGRPQDERWLATRIRKMGESYPVVPR